MGLHTVAVEMILARVEDAERFDKAGAAHPGPARLPRPAVPGARPPVRRIDRARSVGRGSRDAAGADAAPRPARRGPAEAPQQCPESPEDRRRPLPDIAEAQARYGVALVLAEEQNLGRQFLQTALRLGSLDPQYQLWAAWTILQAGYPEEAEPIVQVAAPAGRRGQRSRASWRGRSTCSGRDLPGPTRARRT